MNISIIDDHQLLSELLKVSLSDCDFIKTIKVYNSAKYFFWDFDVHKTDVLIVDMLMPEAMSGVDVIVKCRKTRSKSALKILALSTVTNPNIMKDAFNKGVNGYLSKNASIEELEHAIQYVDTQPDKLYVGENLKDILLQSHMSETINFRLSPREKELLLTVCSGKTVKEIALALDLSVNTIQSYMKVLMRKMEVNRTPDLILKAIRHGLFNPSYAN
ncbi:response regulator [Pedobacter fastidiosus]|uniref:Response regulator transcription factor n=1 Tax=Pedobacter fastidiosus TaxID=2765361 RepID=A0ABR7KXZ2_9SPHI|nr:response regulator transcription factor [Pedobacter fastidiosus]MBC6112888.1 response regulator transcription factor [Pedobacter fastidiosus]